MLYEYAVEPSAIGSNWHNFRYLIEKFGFDRGRLISQFPRSWFKEVIAASAGMQEVERKRFVEKLNQAKQSKVIRSGRPYDPQTDWLQNAVAQQSATPFHAIIAGENPNSRDFIICVDDADESHRLMIAPSIWEVERTGSALADAMAPLLKCANKVLFVDKYFKFDDARYKDTLQKALSVMAANGLSDVRCEIHFAEHPRGAPLDFIEQRVGHWLWGVIPEAMSIALFCWKEKEGGADFHARYLLTDKGGMSVEAGFSAEGAAEKVQLALLDQTLAQTKVAVFDRKATAYTLMLPVLEVSYSGVVGKI